MFITPFMVSVELGPKRMLRFCTTVTHDSVAYHRIPTKIVSLSIEILKAHPTFD
jgi:hypothetical protein